MKKALLWSVPFILTAVIGYGEQFTNAGKIRGTKINAPTVVGTSPIYANGSTVTWTPLLQKATFDNSTSATITTAKLSSSTNSASTTTAANSAAVKAAYDLAASSTVSSIRIGIVSDLHHDFAAQAVTNLDNISADIAANTPLDLMLSGGDNVSLNSGIAAFATWLETNILSTGIQFRSADGNHDFSGLSNPVASSYYTTWRNAFGRGGTDFGPDGISNVYTWNNIAFITLGFESWTADASGPSTAAMDWLETQLAIYKGYNIFVVHHQPITDSGINSSIFDIGTYPNSQSTRLKAICAANKITAWFSGHLHYVAGGGGNNVLSASPAGFGGTRFFGIPSTYQSNQWVYFAPAVGDTTVEIKFRTSTSGGNGSWTTESSNSTPLTLTYPIKLMNGVETGHTHANKLSVDTVGGIMSQTGTTASDAPTLGAEILTSSNWTATDWTGDFATGFTHSTGNVTTLSHSGAASIGTRYVVGYTVSGRTAGSFTVAFGGKSFGGRTATGFFGLKATTTDNLTFLPTTDFNGTIVVSLKVMSAVSTAIQTYKNSANASLSEVRPFSTDSTFYGLNNGRYAYGQSGGVGFGPNTFASLMGGSRNTAMGNQSSYLLESGYDNASFGGSSLSSNITGYYNAAFGASALANSTAYGNAAFGSYGLTALTTGYNNTCAGADCGRTVTTGTTNTFLGYAAGYHASQKVDAVNSMALGNGAYTTASNQIVIGNASVTDTTLRGAVATSGSISGNAPIVTATTLTATHLAGGMISAAKGSTYSAPASAAGMNFILTITSGSGSAVFNPADADTITLDNAATQAAGVSITSTGAVNDFVACYCVVAGNWICKNGRNSSFGAGS